MKKVIALALCLVMVALCFASCGSNSTDTSGAEAERQKTTLKFAIITDENTTAEGIADMQKAFNDYTRPNYSTAVEFVYFTADEYEAKMEREMEYLDYQKIMQTVTELAEINGEEPEDEALAEILGMDMDRLLSLRYDKELEARLKAATPEEDEEEEFEPDDDDDTALVDYPALKESQFDLLIVSNSEMYEKYVANGWLAPITTQLSGTYKLITTMMSDRIFAQTKIADGTDTYAVPTNKAIGKYTYLVFNKEALAEYNISEKSIKGFETVYWLLSAMKIADDNHGLANWKKKFGDDFKPILNSKEDFVYPCVQYFSQNGTDFSMVGMTYDKDTNFSVILEKSLNLFCDPAYVSYLRTVFESESDEFFGNGTGDFLVGLVEGDYGVRNGNDDYYYFPIETPRVDPAEVRHGMLAVSSYSVNVDRTVEIIQKLMTERDLLNTLLYGAKENYDVSAVDNTVSLHANRNYALDREYPVGNLQALAYPCKDYGHDATTYSNILLHNGDLGTEIFDRTFFDFFQYVDTDVWQQIDEKSAEFLADLMDSEDNAAFDAKLAEILDAFDTEAHPEDPFALMMKKQMDLSQQKTLAEAMFLYLQSKIS